jgi:glycosyltransferase involved in cell wall biosynthesis
VTQALRQQARRARVTFQAARHGITRAPSWLAMLRAPAAQGVNVSYGWDRMPALGDVSRGGIVKFEHLAQTLPNRPRDFNVLYLGSSSLPLDARTLVRVARLRGAAYAWNQNGVAYPAWAGDRYRDVNRPMARLLHDADHVLYQSAFCKQSADRFLGERRGPSEILHNPVDTERFTPAPRPERPLTLLLGGSQYQAYRVETALRTLAALPDARLIVAGELDFTADGPAVARRLADELGVAARVEWAGAYTQAEAPALYRRADLLLHTKVLDPCPTAVLEAMACGLPVVYADSGGTPELVADAGVGVESPVDWEVERVPAPDAFADAVRTAAGSLEQLSRTARTRAVERFDLTRWVARHVELFESLVAARLGAE